MEPIISDSSSFEIRKPVDFTDVPELHEIMRELGPSKETGSSSLQASDQILASSDTTAGVFKQRLNNLSETPVSLEGQPEKAKGAKAFDDAFVKAGRSASMLVGVPVAVVGKLMGGLIGLGVALPASVAGGVAAGIGWMASGLTGGDKYARKEAAASEASIAIGAFAPITYGMGTLLTPLSATAKFVENFGKALIPKDVEPKCYTDFNNSFKTHILPFYMTVGKEAVAANKEIAKQNKEIAKENIIRGAVKKEFIPEVGGIRKTTGLLKAKDTLRGIAKEAKSEAHKARSDAWKQGIADRALEKEGKVKVGEVMNLIGMSIGKSEGELEEIHSELQKELGRQPQLKDFANVVSEKIAAECRNAGLDKQSTNKAINFAKESAALHYMMKYEKDYFKQNTELFRRDCKSLELPKESLERIMDKKKKWEEEIADKAKKAPVLEEEYKKVNIGEVKDHWVSELNKEMEVEKPASNQNAPIQQSPTKPETTNPREGQ